MSYRKVDASDPRRPELVRPLSLPKAWKTDDLDIYASFLGSVSMMSGAAMLTRAPYIAYAGLVFACAHIAHDRPFKSKRTSEVSTGGPFMSLIFAFLALIALILPTPHLILLENLLSPSQQQSMAPTFQRSVTLMINASSLYDT
uniref:Rba2 protein n=1 Tax=Sporisorium reilianum TaxID=72558 RepID=Q4A3E8_9BASI|nr:rba2 protein [Sporisorium reilianum]